MIIPDDLGKTVGKSGVKAGDILFQAVFCDDSARHAVVEAVDDQSRVFEKLMDVRPVEFFANGVHLLTYCAIQCVSEDLGLSGTDIVGLKRLGGQIVLLHTVAINDREPLHTGPGKTLGDIGTESSSTADHNIMTS